MSCYRDLTLDTPGPGEHKTDVFFVAPSPKDPTPVPAAAAAGLLIILTNAPIFGILAGGRVNFCLPPGRYSRRARSVECCANCNRCRGALTTAAPPSGIAPTWLYRLSHRSARGAADEMRVLGEHAGERVRLRRPPGRAPAPQLRRRQV